MTKHIVILSDIKYLVFGVTSIQSLIRTTTIPLIIHYYCTDVDAYNILSNIQLSTDIVRVIPYHPSCIFKKASGDTIALTTHKHKTPQYFFWTLASYFSNYIMTNTECDSVTYIDSDIVFNNDISILYDEFKNKDCGIFKHKFMFTGINKDKEFPQGRYNVGVVYFKNSELGKRLLSWWADAVLYKKYPEYSTMGDQKYLEYFPKVCKPDEIYIDENIGHTASWDWSVCDSSKLKDGIIIWNDTSYIHLFTHFSKFMYNFDNDTFECIQDGLYLNINDCIEKYPDIYDIHKAYYQSLKDAHKLLQSSTSIKLPTSSYKVKQNISKFIWNRSR